LCAAKASPLESTHALARFPASLQILSASGSFFAVTTSPSVVMNAVDFRLFGAISI